MDSSKETFFRLYHIAQEIAQDAETTARKLKELAKKLKEEYEKK